MADPGTWSIIIGGVSLMLNAANFFYTTKKTKSEARRQRIFSTIDELTDASRETANEVERHLTFEKERKRKPEIYRMERKCKALANRLGDLLPKSRGEILAAYHVWYLVLLGEGFPVEKAAEKIATDSARYRDIGVGQLAFEATLGGITNSTFS